MSEERKVPKLRFKGYTDDWKHQRLGDFVEQIVGGGTPKTSDESLWSGTINWFTPSEVGELKYIDESERKINGLAIKKSSAKLLPKNRTVLYSSRATIGNTAIITSDSTTNQGFQSFVCIDAEDANYIYYYADKITHNAKKLAFGSTFLEISKRELESINIFVPDKAERNQISALLSKIDKLITLEQEKQNKLTNVRDRLIELMYTYNKENLNFNNTSHNIKEDFIGDLIGTISANKFIASSRENGTYVILQQGDKPVAGYSNQKPFMHYENVLVFGDHTLSLYKPNYPFLLATDGLKIIESKDFDRNYLFFLLQKNMPISQGYKRHFTILKNTKVTYTNDSVTQNKVGNFLNNIDIYIKKHDKYLKMIENIKNELLNQMFV